MIRAALSTTTFWLTIADFFRFLQEFRRRLRPPAGTRNSGLTLAASASRHRRHHAASMHPDGASRRTMPPSVAIITVAVALLGAIVFVGALTGRARFEDRDLQ